jgi:hypothetical protein
MNTEKIWPLAKGLVKSIPGVDALRPKHTGGTISGRYCYAVWLRHLNHMIAAGSPFPRSIAELGPGDSLGIGLAALLSGCQEYYALDVVKYWDVERNLNIFDQLVELFESRAPVPTRNEFPKMKPDLEDYGFPRDTLTDARLGESLAAERRAKIRAELENIESANTTFIRYHIPWYDSQVIQRDSVDFIYSQAVLEHVEDLENTYSAMFGWLKPNGVMSHQIDFKSHGITRSWNGHWTFSDFEWRIVRSGKTFYINREPYSTHLRLLEKHGFTVKHQRLYPAASAVSRHHLRGRFTSLSDEELSTTGMFVLAEKKVGAAHWVREPRA